MTAARVAGPGVDPVPRVPWPAFLDAFDWRQGEHVSLIGPTGGGKTTLAIAILPRRQYVVALGTKPADRTLDQLVRRGWRLVRSWKETPTLAARRELRVVLWPRYRTPADVPRQAAELHAALQSIFAAGGWCVFADEAFYLCKRLRLTQLLEDYWTQGRSLGLSLVASTQRPAHVPLYLYDQATHLFFWRDNDETNLRRIGGLGGTNAAAVRRLVATLAEHDVLYLNTRTGQMLVTRVE